MARVLGSPAVSAGPGFQHNVVAERYGTPSDLRHELESGEHIRHHLTMREWLEAPAA